MPRELSICGHQLGMIPQTPRELSNRTHVDTCKAIDRSYARRTVSWGYGAPGTNDTLGRRTSACTNTRGSCPHRSQQAKLRRLQDVVNTSRKASLISEERQRAENARGIDAQKPLRRLYSKHKHLTPDGRRLSTYILRKEY